jgi:hypothetical protein
VRRIAISIAARDPSMQRPFDKLRDLNCENPIAELKDDMVRGNFDTMGRTIFIIG